MRRGTYAAIDPLFWLSVLCLEGVRRARAGELAGWSVNGLPANVRLGRYLARGEAWPDPGFAPYLVELGDLAFFPES